MGKGQLAEALICELTPGLEIFGGVCGVKTIARTVGHIWIELDTPRAS